MGILVHIQKDGVRSVQSTDALLIVDVQRDFLPGGALAVPDGDRVIPALNRWIRRFQEAGQLIVASRDWHPTDHGSFVEQGGPWPSHCVAGTAGAQLSELLELPETVLIVDKGTERQHDGYSAFEHTTLHSNLRKAQIKALFVGGLATEYCVLNTVVDAVELGYQVRLIEAGICALDPAKGGQAIERMRSLGVTMASFPAVGQ